MSTALATARSRDSIPGAKNPEWLGKRDAAQKDSLQDKPFGSFPPLCSATSHGNLIPPRTPRETARGAKNNTERRAVKSAPE